MSVAVHQEGNIGSVFIFTVKREDGTVVDLNLATTLDARFRAAPNLGTVVFPGVLHTDGTDGKFRYVTVADTDLAPFGERWQRQGFVIVPGLGEFKTEVRCFPVKANL